jgi:integrase
VTKTATKGLTDFAIKALAQPGMFRDPGCTGLYAQVTVAKNGSLNKSFIYRFKLAGRAREMGLGSYPTKSLAIARAEASEARDLALKGIDPIAERKRTKAEAGAECSRTFKNAAESYLEDNAKRWKWRLAVDQNQSLLERYAYKKLGARDVRDIEFADVVAVLKPVFAKAPTAASKLRSLIERVLDAAAGDGFRDPNAVNPAAVRGALRQAMDAIKAKERVHHAAPERDDAPVIFAKVHAAEGTVYRAIEWLILSTTRLQETFAATWDEIDLEKGLWVIPKKRMKRNREHLIPLTSAMIAVLEKQKIIRQNDLLFPGRAGAVIAGCTPKRAMERLGVEGITNHGWRSVWADWAGDLGNIEHSVATFQLAHGIRDATESAYRRKTAVERRRQALEAYHAWLAGETIEADNVVTFTKAKTA